ncbi:MAG TPA: hypothetical protein PL033_05965 [Candidatus Brocadiia bacterium]|nr:hypothetical protein [Candidatus Brocadiia bacterium]
MSEDQTHAVRGRFRLAVGILIVAGGVWLFYLLTYRVGGTTATREAWTLAGGLMQMLMAAVLISIVGIGIHMALFPRRLCPWCGATWWGRREDCPECDGRPPQSATPAENGDIIDVGAPEEVLDSDLPPDATEWKGDCDET